jgi:hypothetical protein
MKSNQTLFVIIAIVMTAIIVMPVQAQNMSISTLGISGDQDIMIYNTDGTLYGMWNTSSPYIPLPDTDFNVVLKPTLYSSWLDNPGTFLNDAVNYIIKFWLSLFVIFGGVAIVFSLAYMGRRR